MPEKTRRPDTETTEPTPRHDDDPRYDGTDPHDTYPGERRVHPPERQRTAEGGGARRGSPARRESRRQ